VLATLNLKQALILQGGPLMAAAEPGIRNLPTALIQHNPSPSDPLDQSNYQREFPGNDNSKSPGDSRSNSGDASEANEIKPGDATFGANFSDLFTDFDQFIKDERSIVQALRTQEVNQINMTFYPNDVEPKFLNFIRKSLKEHLDQVDGTNARSRAFASWAKVKLAGLRRAYEMRMHPRMAFYAFGFIDNWIIDLALKQEHELIHKGAGDE
jgi:hypothetical protein